MAICQKGKNTFTIIKPWVILIRAGILEPFEHVVCAIGNIPYPKTQCISSVWMCMRLSTLSQGNFRTRSYTLSFTANSIVRFIPEISLFMQCKQQKERLSQKHNVNHVKEDVTHFNSLATRIQFIQFEHDRGKFSSPDNCDVMVKMLKKKTDGGRLYNKM